LSIHIFELAANELLVSAAAVTVGIIVLARGLVPSVELPVTLVVRDSTSALVVADTAIITAQDAERVALAHIAVILESIAATTERVTFDFASSPLGGLRMMPAMSARHFFLLVTRPF